MDPQKFMNWVLRMVRLDTSVFDEVKGDVTATVPAVVVAAASTFLFGLGGLLWWVFKDFPEKGDFLLKSFILGSLFSIGLWFVWLVIVYLILTQLYRANADIQQMIRVGGFAAVPLAIAVLMIIPGISFGVGLVAVAAFFALTQTALQTVTDAGYQKVFMANLAGMAVWAIVLTLLASKDNTFAPGIFAWDTFADAFSEIIGAFQSALEGLGG